MALPGVCSDADGLAENVADGVTGFVVPRREPAALATALGQLAADPALRAQMGAAGRERAHREFRPAEQIAAFDRFYQDVLAGQRASGPQTGGVQPVTNEARATNPHQSESHAH